MLIRVKPSGEIVLEQPDDFRAFAIRLEPGEPGRAEQALADWARLDGIDHAWVDPDALRALPGATITPEWETGFEGLIVTAAKHDWIDESGSIRAHIERS